MNLPLRSINHSSSIVNPLNMDRLMQLAKAASPTLDHSLSAFGEQSIGSFLSQIPIEPVEAYQSCEDLLTYVKNYVSRIFDPQTARRTIDDLRKHPMILTANHHGVDFFAQSLQGSLLFSLLKTSPSVNCTTVPIFACGNIPLNNLTYPRGALIYKADASIIEKIPINLPLFSDKRKRAIVSAVEPFGDSMITRSLKRLDLWRQEKRINPIITNTVKSLFNDIYGTSEVLAQESYSDQSVIINHHLWQRLFTSSQSAPDMIYLELERIVSHLLTLDLCQPHSLASMFIMDDHYRNKIINTLDDTPGCWNQQLLAQRIDITEKQAHRCGPAQRCGTHFFWGIDSHGRRFPLCLVNTAGRLKKLVGIDDRGKCWSYDFKAAEIIKALTNGRLVPSLFTSYMTVSFSRGLTCIGGYYQSNYLPIMQLGLVDVLKQCGDHNIADKIAAISTKGYLSGMQAVTTAIDSRYLIPAGPIEIIASGGISNDELTAIQKIKVNDAHLASLCDTVVDIIPDVVRKEKWKRPLLSEMYKQLSQRTICKRFGIIN